MDMAYQLVVNTLNVQVGRFTFSSVHPIPFINVPGVIRMVSPPVQSEPLVLQDDEAEDDLPTYGRPQ